MTVPNPQDELNEETVSILEEAERLKLNSQHEESIALLEQLLTRDPTNVAALEEVADNELSMERYDRAVVAAKRAVVLDQQSYTAHYVLGFVASLREDWKMAVRELREANRLKPNNPEILRCLGWALFNLGDRVQGIVTLERSLNLDPENPLSLCDLGVCYLYVRNFKKAQSLFSRALEIDPSNERARECVEAVARLSRRVQG
jgi:tetratricopeptide (TPR) repeat protein